MSPRQLKNKFCINFEHYDLPNGMISSPKTNIVLLSIVSFKILLLKVLKKFQKLICTSICAKGSFSQFWILELQKAQGTLGINIPLYIIYM